MGFGCRPALSPGSSVRDTYVVEQFIGAGAFGDVYRVHHRFLGRQALKIIRSGEEGADEVLAEARVLVALNHPDIVRVFDADVAEIDGVEYPFFTMEYVEGGTLARLLQGRIRLSPTEALAIAGQLLSALAVAHALEPPVLHRDVTPGNILVVDPATVDVKLSDFGLAAHVDPDVRLLRAAGTIRYQPPESAWGYATIQSDLYAVGLILYELLTAVRRFRPAGGRSHDGRRYSERLDRTSVEGPGAALTFSPRPRSIDRRSRADRDRAPAGASVFVSA